MAGAVVLSATGGALVGPAKLQAAAETRQELLAQQVAQVWRDAGSQGLAGASGASALQAELLSDRGESASRSEDRLVADQEAAQEAAQAADQPAGQTAQPSAGTSAQAPATAPSNPVAQAEQRVRQLVVQQDADAEDALHASRSADASAAQALQDIAAAQQRRAEEAAAAALAAAQADPRSVARSMLAEHGWGPGQFSCLDSLWTKESGWSWSADNPSSSAYGIPQSLPGDKMASFGADWRTDPRVQIAWGLSYIADSYGTPCRAWAHSQSYGWY